jgi:hypothetical protein
LLKLFQLWREPPRLLIALRSNLSKSLKPLQIHHQPVLMSQKLS